MTTSPGLAHGGHDAVQVVQVKAFLQDETAGQVQGLRAEHGHVVDRAVHGQGAYVAAGEEDGVHGEAVGADRQGAFGARQQGRVVHAPQDGVAQMAEEHFVHETVRGEAAAALVQKELVAHGFPMTYAGERSSWYLK